MGSFGEFDGVNDRSDGCLVHNNGSKNTRAIVRPELSTFNAQVGVFSADKLWISYLGCGLAQTKTPVSDRRFCD
jgi:hypothetical protein